MEENRVYGYARVSTRTQNIERQITNIQKAYPEAEIRSEKFTGTQMEGRKKLNTILEDVEKGDTIVFDSVSRMSRNADEGIDLYMALQRKGVNLVFLKEPHINTSVYKDALKNRIPLQGNEVDYILEGINKYMHAIAKVQIRIAFDQAEKEVTDLRQRTKEGIREARRRGKKPGRPKGCCPQPKYKDKYKEDIRRLSKTFDGQLKDKEVLKIVPLSNNTYYKYKREIKAELEENTKKTKE